MWEVKRRKFGKDSEKLLKEGWKPFAVTSHGNEDYIWLRRKKEDR